MSTMNKAKALDRAIAYTLPRVGKAGMNIKQQQREALKCVYDGNDVFIWLPTGFGKSLCYEAWPYVIDYKLGTDRSMALVISPLVSLMIDQVRSLHARCVPAAILSSNTSGSYSGCHELLAKDSCMCQGKYKLLFAAPEAILGGDRWTDMLLKELFASHLVGVAIDEAHCVSEW